jgi:hypothetical protein
VNGRIKALRTTHLESVVAVFEEAGYSDNEPTHADAQAKKLAESIGRIKALFPGYRPRAPSRNGLARRGFPCELSSPLLSARA